MHKLTQKRDEGLIQTTARLLPATWWQTPIAQLAQLAPIQAIQHSELNTLGVHLSVKREDLLCPYLGGNKLYKLHFHLQRALALNTKTLATFGGAYSNHIYALARAGCELGIKTLGIIRGEKPSQLSPTLNDAVAMGMSLIFVSRDSYKRKQTYSQQCAWGLNKPGLYLIPEGGGDLRGALGMAEYWRHVQRALASNNEHYDAVIIAAGTGASLAGIMAASEHVSVHGVLALKGSAKLTQQYAKQTLIMANTLRRKFLLGADPICWQLHTQSHGGGYGPAKGPLKDNIQQLEQQMAVPLDPVYTGKMMAAIVDLARQGLWQGQRVLAIHSGGLQGARTH